MKFPFLLASPMLVFRRVHRVDYNFILPEGFGKTLRRLLVLGPFEYAYLRLSTRRFEERSARLRHEH